MNSIFSVFLLSHCFFPTVCWLFLQSLYVIKRYVLFKASSFKDFTQLLCSEYSELTAQQPANLYEVFMKERFFLLFKEKISPLRSVFVFHYDCGFF